MSDECKCGRPLTGCEYHDPALQPPPPPDTEPLTWDDIAIDLPASGHCGRPSVVVWGAAHMRKGERMTYTTRTGAHRGTVTEVRPNGSVVLTLDGEVRGVSLSGTLRL